MVDPGSLVVAFTGIDMAVIGFLMYRYAGEMEPAPFEGTIYEHASQRAREEAYRLTGVILSLAGLAAAAISLLLGMMPGFYVIVGGTVLSIAVHFTVLRRKAEEYLLEEPVPEICPGEAIILEPPGLPARLLSCLVSLAQAPLLWNTLCYYLEPDTSIIIATWLVAELPVLVTVCMTLCWPEAYANPCITVRLYKLVAVTAPLAASLFPLGVYALLQGVSLWQGIAFMIAGVVVLSLPALLCVSRKNLKGIIP